MVMNPMRKSMKKHHPKTTKSTFLWGSGSPTSIRLVFTRFTIYKFKGLSSSKSFFHGIYFGTRKKYGFLWLMGIENPTFCRWHRADFKSFTLKLAISWFASAKHVNFSCVKKHANHFEMGLLLFFVGLRFFKGFSLKYFPLDSTETMSWWILW